MPRRSDILEQTLIAVREAIDSETRYHRRTWFFCSLVVAAMRGIVTDKLVTDAHGFRAINDEDFGDWLLRHGAHPDVLDPAMVRGLYDLVFGYGDGHSRCPAVAAGVMAFLIGHVLFEYRGRTLLEDDCGNGRRCDRAALSGIAKARSPIEVFPSFDALHLDPSRQRSTPSPWAVKPGLPKAFCITNRLPGSVACRCSRSFR